MSSNFKLNNFKCFRNFNMWVNRFQGEERMNRLKNCINVCRFVCFKPYASSWRLMRNVQCSSLTTTHDASPSGRLFKDHFAIRWRFVRRKSLFAAKISPAGILYFISTTEKTFFFFCNKVAAAAVTNSRISLTCHPFSSFVSSYEVPKSCTTCKSVIPALKIK